MKYFSFLVALVLILPLNSTQALDPCAHTKRAEESMNSSEVHDIFTGLLNSVETAKNYLRHNYLQYEVTVYKAYKGSLKAGEKVKVIVLKSQTKGWDIDEHQYLFVTFTGIGADTEYFVNACAVTGLIENFSDQRAREDLQWLNDHAGQN